MMSICSIVKTKAFNNLNIFRIEHDDTGDSPDWFLEKVGNFL